LLLQDIHQAVKKLPQYQIMFQSDSNRVQIHKFSLWLTRLINKIDESHPEIVYILPESFVEIPFEIFRAFKRGNVPLYETEEEKTKLYPEEYNAVY